MRTLNPSKFGVGKKPIHIYKKKPIKKRKPIYTYSKIGYKVYPAQTLEKANVSRTLKLRSIFFYYFRLKNTLSIVFTDIPQYEKMVVKLYHFEKT